MHAGRVAAREQIGDARVVEHEAFGDLELEPVRRQAALAQLGEHALDEVRIVELARGNVERDERQRLDAAAAELGEHVADAREHVVADRQDQRGFLGEPDEFGRRNPAALGMVPAHQRFVAGDVAADDFLDRLQAHFELAALERGAQFAFETDLVESARILARVASSSSANAVGLVAGQRRQRGAIARQLAHQERAHDRVGGGEPLGELVAVDRSQHAVGQRACGRGARRIVEHGHLAEQHARARARPRIVALAALQRRRPRPRRSRSGRRVVGGSFSAKMTCCRRGIRRDGRPWRSPEDRSPRRDSCIVGCQAAAIGKKRGPLARPSSCFGLRRAITRSPCRSRRRRSTTDVLGEVPPAAQSPDQPRELAADRFGRCATVAPSVTVVRCRSASPGSPDAGTMPCTTRCRPAARTPSR